MAAALEDLRAGDITMVFQSGHRDRRDGSAAEIATLFPFVLIRARGTNTDEPEYMAPLGYVLGDAIHVGAAAAGAEPHHLRVLRREISRGFLRDGSQVHFMAGV
jgi:hypothetical protein